MIVTVASGKGGTGKTTVATSLALAAAEGDGGVLHGEDNGRVGLLDCDVEEPNAHLFLRPTIEERQEVGVLTPVVDEGRCLVYQGSSQCRRCAEACAYHAIAVLGRQVLIFPELCHGCGSCTMLCPAGAIREEMRVTGVVETGLAGRVAFGQGTLNVGEAMAVPVIRALKKQIGETAGDHLIVLDAPPGTSCPVVECLRGADYALLVTEPTPFGLHDLVLAVEVARGELGMPVGVVINRDGVGDDGVDRYCRQERIPILMRIPLDRRIAEACSEGIPLIAALPEYRPMFIALRQRMLEEASR
jgi:MinD superfamily P-loop ATPase